MKVKFKERRVAKVSIEPTVLAHLVQNRRPVICENPIPSDAQFRGFCHNPEANTIDIFYEHPSFAPVPEGAVCPRHVLTYRYDAHQPLTELGN